MTTKIERWEGDLGPGNNGFEHHLFHLDTFEGYGFGGWRIRWKAARNRLTALMLELEPKDAMDKELDIATALGRLGYVRAESPLQEAAPELLKALTILAEAVEVDVAMFAGQPQKESALGIARAAIAKATGHPAGATR